MPAYENVLNRRSVRSYTNEPVPRPMLEKILDAGRLAPTARNEQPWEFVCVTATDRRRQLAALTDHGKFIADAPGCIVVLCRDTKYYLEDGCAATTQMMIAAQALGLGTCWIAGDKKPYAPQVVALCGAPADLRLVSLITVGYAAEEPAPSKRALADLVHWESY